MDLDPQASTPIAARDAENSALVMDAVELFEKGFAYMHDGQKAKGERLIRAAFARLVECRRPSGGVFPADEPIAAADALRIGGDA